MHPRHLSRLIDCVVIGLLIIIFAAQICLSHHF